MSRDGAFYIKQAYFFSIGDFASAMQVYEWPFFSYLVAETHLILGTSLFHSAQLINVFLFLVACFYFFRILNVITKDQNILFSGFIVIITSIPLMDDYLIMMLRDNGAWAGFMAGSYYFVIWLKRGYFVDSLKWQLSFFAAMLFRVEVYSAAILLPFLSFYYHRRTPRNLQYLFLNFSVMLSALMCAVIFSFYKYGWNGLLSIDLGRFSALYFRPKHLLASIGTPLPLKVVNHENLQILIDRHQIALKYGFLSYVAIYSWLSGLKILHAATCWTAIKNKLIANRDAEALLALFLTALLASITFVFTNLETGGRYWVMSWWIVYLLSALGLCHWIKILLAMDSRWRWLPRLALVVVVLSYVLVVLFDSSPPHRDRYNAISWLKQHEVDPTEIYTDDSRALAMLLGKYEVKPISLDEAVAKGYQYLLVTDFKQKKLDLELRGYHLLESFPDKQNPKILIYKSN
jgi:hypothetical protein